MAFAFFLAKENRELLLGESITTRQYNSILQVVRNMPEVAKVVTLRTMHLGPKDILVGIEVNLINNLVTDQIESVTDKIEEEIMKLLPESKRDFIFVEIQS